METILPLAKCFVRQACQEIFLLSVVPVFFFLYYPKVVLILNPKEVILTRPSDKGLGPGVPLGVVRTLEDRSLEESITPLGFFHSLLWRGFRSLKW